MAQQTNSKKIESYYSGENTPKGKGVIIKILETFNPLQRFQSATSDNFENKLLDFSELETLRTEIQKLHAEKDEIQILVDERDRTIRILSNDVSDKSSELARLADENINFREAISNSQLLTSIENQNERFKEKIDEMSQINEDKEEEINRLIELLKDHESQQQSENGNISFLTCIDYEVECIQFQKELAAKDEQLKEAELKLKQKQDLQIDQINNLNKDRIKSEREVENVRDEMQRLKELNDKQQKKVNKQMEEIKRMDEYILQLEES